MLEKGLSSLTRELRTEGYDFIIDLHRNLRSLYVKSKLRSMWFSVNKINFARFLMIRFKVNRLPDKHIVDRYFETVRHFDLENDGKGLEYHIPGEDEINLSLLPSAFQHGYIALVPGAQHGTKQMPAEKIIRICRELVHPIILLGGRREEELGRAIAGQTGDHVLNACGQYNINQSASLVRQSQLVITHDTGLMHIAAAFKKKILSVWGHTIPEFGMYPYLPDPASRIFQIPGLSCRPCTRTGKEKCPRGHFRCMNDIDEREIIRTAMEIFRPTAQ
jgi:ADP-heptose:LPS heptosyltransferase